MALGIYRENIISQCENNVKEKPASAPISTRSAACRSHSFCASLDYCDAFGYCATLNYRVALLLNAVSCSCRTYNTTRPRAARSAAIYSQTAAPASAACSCLSAAAAAIRCSTCPISTAVLPQSHSWRLLPNTAPQVECACSACFYFACSFCHAVFCMERCLYDFSVGV